MLVRGAKDWADDVLASIFVDQVFPEGLPHDVIRRVDAQVHRSSIDGRAVCERLLVDPLGLVIVSLVALLGKAELVKFLRRFWLLASTGSAIRASVSVRVEAELVLHVLREQVGVDRALLLHRYVALALSVGQLLVC